MPVQFGEFVLDESRRQLLRRADPVHLSPKAFQLLSILVEERPRAVSKADLQSRLWPETFVTEGNLTTTVGELRSALGDDAREPRFIRTVHGFGYSFAGSVKPPPRFAKRWLTAAAAGVVIAAGIVLIFWLRGTALRAVPPPIQSLAILPFDARDADPADRHLGIGLSDVLITRLSNVHHLIVRPTSAIREFAERGGDSRQIGRKLKVDAVLEGSIRTSADHIRVTVQLLNIREQRPIWAEQFDEKRTQMFAIEDSISARVADALMVRISPAEKIRLAKRYTTDAAAYQLYIQGRYHLQRAIEGQPKERKVAVDFYSQAVRKDPTYALAWAGLALGYAGLGVFNQMPPRDVWPNAQAAALRSLELDGNLPEAHTAIGAVRMFWLLDFAGAEREFLRALELDPREILALRYYASLLQNTGRFDESITLHERQIEIDPLSPAVHLGLAGAYYAARRYDRAIQEDLIVLGMNPQFAQAHIALSRSYALQGHYGEAIAEAQKAAGSGRPNAGALAHLGYALARAGRREEANQILRDLRTRFEKEKFSPFLPAIVYIALGERKEVFPLLEKGVDERTYIFGLKTDPLLDPVRSDPRFSALLKRAGYGS
jgi:serine/threonine-protein kinase